MNILKFVNIICIFICTTIIGMKYAKKYSKRLDNLLSIKNMLNIFKAKIKFTSKSIPDIFKEMSENIENETKEIFIKASEYMKNMIAKDAFNKAIDESNVYLKKEDKDTIKELSKMLGDTDIEGQISQIELVEGFLENNIKQAEEEKEKNGKLYKRLGITTGLIIAIILV